MANAHEKTLAEIEAYRAAKRRLAIIEDEGARAAARRSAMVH